MEKHIKKYLSLLAEIDSLSERLESNHKSHMNCKPGCDFCCMDYSVFPIEFYSMRKHLGQNKSKPRLSKNAEPEDCIFLVAHKCTIYTERPIICRTHGLPLLYTGEDGNWELSACELNFTEFNMDNFSVDNTFPQDKYNSKLFMLNKEFVKDFKEKKYGEYDLIPIKRLKEFI